MATRKEARKQGKGQASGRKGPVTTKRPRKATPAAPEGKATYSIVGIGASAGGLEALQELFKNMPADTGMGFVIVSHLDPSHVTMLPELIGKTTKMPVSEAKNQTSIKPNNIYIIPRNKNIAIFNRKLILLELAEPHGLRFPIDFFLKSLADDQGTRAICVILSGTGTDGTIGLQAVKARSGLAIVQEPGSAKYNGMPESAISTGLVDFVLPPLKIANQLASLAASFKTKPVPVLPLAADRLTGFYEKIFWLIRQYTKHDFSQYKRPTITRRIERRMVVNQISSIGDYVSFLERNPAEVKALFKDILISVTGFFRDSEAFIALKECLTDLISTIPETAVIRAWVPGCATGEEAYSIAILIQECLHKTGRDNQVQIFASDIDEVALNKARTGSYPMGIATDITQDRLKHFFVQKEDVYAVKKEIRGTLVFSAHDVNKDPPFTKVDLICCRNLLIYFNPVLQTRLLSQLHYALNEGGILFLGPSETTGKSAELFITLNSKWKIFKRSSSASKFDVLRVAPYQSGFQRAEPASRTTSQEDETINVIEMVRKKLLREHTPAAVVVNSQNNIIYIHGKITNFLELPAGPINTNILDMARPGIRNELSNALQRAFLQGRETSHHDLKVKQEGDIVDVDLKISPLVYAKEKPTLCIVTFQALTPAKSEAPAGTASRHGKRTDQIAELEQEIQTTKEILQSTIEELETSNEEMKSTNEELQSTNEELQSSNEEMETSREELQSINEELLTVNNECQAKIEELNELNDDLQNFFNSTAIATIFLDMDLHLKRFTPASTKIFNIIDSDIGRPITHITSKIVYDQLERDLQEVLDTLIPRSVEVQAQDSLFSYALRILPYRTSHNAIQGVVMNIVDITAEKKAAQEIGTAGRRVAESIVDTVREPLLVLDSELRVISTNKAFYDMFKVSREETETRFIYDMGNKQWDIPQLRHLLEEILPQNSKFHNYKVEHKFPTIGEKTMLLNARKIVETSGQSPLILLAIEDITEKN